MRYKKACALLALVAVVIAGLCAWQYYRSKKVLTIYDYQTHEVYLRWPVEAGDKLYFGWVHSWEKIPWHEYYHITAENTLVLDTIAFPAFGAGIPENKGTRTRVENGLIYMEGIGQVFHEFTWINSHFATRDIRVNDFLIKRGLDLPEHTRVNLTISNRGLFDDGR